MNIFITCPNFSRHGGIRVILEWANRLSENHIIYLRTDDIHDCNWFNIKSNVHIVRDDSYIWKSDCLIISSPHGVEYLHHPARPEKTFVFCQMAEHLFRLNDVHWQNFCRRFYLADAPMISISKWNEDLFRKAGRKGKIYQVGNGVNLDHFPISDKPKNGKIVLVEGWEPGNPTKDWDRIGPRVAQRLKKDGYIIWTYITSKLSEKYRSIPNRVAFNPNQEQLNDLYEKATILIKASKYDARSCSPMEAMTKGTVSARAIYEGDDDLKHRYNCLRSTYNEDDLYDNAKRLLNNPDRREELANNCIEYIKTFNWDYWMNQIESILVGSK